MIARTIDKVSPEIVVQLAAESGITINPEHEAEWAEVLTGLDASAQAILAMEDYIPEIDLDRYPRNDIHVPEDTAKGGWALKMALKSTAPVSRELEGRTVAIKDNIGIAGVPCTNGTAAMPGWLPAFDATLVTRILDAGGTITGKSACENGCYESTSETAVSGVVDNPWADGYSAGGSSSGSASLVASGAVDMSIGCDQGGSIRMPASFCGIVGLKPTWGLVPYTGIIGLDSSIDHAGPMTSSVLDCALLLQVIAGYDGLDDRQQHAPAHGEPRYVDDLSRLLRTPEPAHLLRGLRIGVIEEGFGLPYSDSKVDAVVKSAAGKFRDLGASVRMVSIPVHKQGQLVWGVATFAGSYRQSALGCAQGRKQAYMTERVARCRVGQKEFDCANVGAKNMQLSGMFLEKYYGPALYARCKNLSRKFGDDYDSTFKDVDVLITPTTPFAAPKHALNQNPVERLSNAIGLTFNTSPFDATGHPAISIPVGFVPAREQETIQLPVGMQIIGPKFSELLLLRVAGSWEKVYNWKTFVYGFADGEACSSSLSCI